MLNDTKIRAAKPADKPYRLGDSGQLYLQVTPSGGRHWRMNYTFGRNDKGKPLQKTLSFGSYPAVSLAEAREARDRAKSILAKGLDPAVERRRAEQADDVVRRNTFRAVAEEWFELNSGWSLGRLAEWADAHGGRWSASQAEHWTKSHNGRWSAVHAADVLTSLERDVLPSLGGTAITAIASRDVLDTLRAVERRGAIETAHRLRQRISAVFVYGIALGACDTDVAASLGSILAPIPRATPQPSIVDGLLDQDERLTAIRQLLIDCEAERCRATTKLALRFLALTAVRPGELAGAKWDEFRDLDGNEPLWVIPTGRMKGDKQKKDSARHDHLVPLAWQAVDVLVALRRLTGRYTFCFTSDRHVHRQMSENTLRALLIRAGYHQRHVPHGFRAAFSTIMNERPANLRQDGDRHVIDMMLAHTPSDRARGDDRRTAVSSAEMAYNRAAHMARRRALAQQWADMLLADFWPAVALVGGPMRWAATGPGHG
ncbi:tyrosine-type recombinase/integrase [Sphingomonas sp. ID0503]|uniref:tyrosine-type recombinase/integrase n=1 Tax=Sphingomonas sp. ID0503 TaxID=3399691 RepID=UPI003AFA89D6